MAHGNDPRSRGNRHGDARFDPDRRRFLAAIGLGSSAFIAGCTGGDDEGTPTDVMDGDPDDDSETEGDSDTESGDDTGSGGEPVVDTFTVHTSPALQLERVGFNPYNPTTDEYGFVTWLSADPPIRYNIRENEFVPKVISDWEVTEESATWTISEEYAWETGEPLTADDFATAAHLQIGVYGGDPPYIEDVTVHGEREFEFALSDQYNPQILLGELSLDAFYSDGPLGEFADRYADASSEEEYDEITSELEELAIDPQQGDPVHSYGPFVLDEVTESYVSLVPNEHHPHSDNLNFDEVEGIKTGERATVQGLIQSGNLDHAWSRFSNTFLESVPDKYEVWEKQAFGGNSIDFQLESDIYGIREVRQALNYLLDKELMTEAVDFNQIPDRHMTGMPDSIAEGWIDEETLDSFTDYTGRNDDEAARLLREAGFEEGSNTWLTPDGEEWMVEFTAPAGDADRVQQLETARDIVRDFGIDSELTTIETSTYWQRYRERDWEIAIWAYGSRSQPHPYFDFQHQYRGLDPDEPRPSPEEAAWAGTPLEVEVPMPVGDPDGSLETYPFRDRIFELRETLEEDRATELVTELAWVYNQYAFKVPIAVESQPNIMNQRDWEYPSEDEYYHKFLSQIPWNQMMSDGVFRAREE